MYVPIHVRDGVKMDMLQHTSTEKMQYWDKAPFE